MSRRKSPRLTPASLDANRHDTSKSTVPRTAHGRQHTLLNRLGTVRGSRFLDTLVCAPPAPGTGLRRRRNVRSKSVMATEAVMFMKTGALQKYIRSAAAAQRWEPAVTPNTTAGTMVVEIGRVGAAGTLLIQNSGLGLAQKRLDCYLKGRKQDLAGQTNSVMATEAVMLLKTGRLKKYIRSAAVAAWQGQPGRVGPSGTLLIQNPRLGARK